MLFEYVTAIGISLTSLHFPHDGQNQFNPGIAMEAENVRAGIYYNSGRRVTAYLGYALPVYESPMGIKVSLFGALATGYRLPVVGGVEFGVGEHVVIYAAPPVRGAKSGTTSNETTSPFTLGLVLRKAL